MKNSAANKYYDYMPTNHDDLLCEVCQTVVATISTNLGYFCLRCYNLTQDDILSLGGADDDDPSSRNTRSRRQRAPTGDGQDGKNDKSKAAKERKVRRNKNRERYL